MRWSRKRTRSAFGSKLCRSLDPAVNVDVAVMESTNERPSYPLGTPIAFTWPIIALAAVDFRSPCVTLTWLKPNSFPQLSLIRLFAPFMEGVLGHSPGDCQAICNSEH